MINENILRQWWQVFRDGSELVEVRILGKFSYSGYFKNIDNLIECIKPYEEMPDEQIYFTLNVIDDGCYGRAQCEKFVKSPKQTTSDANITKRKWVLIDYDPVRVVGTNATEEEFEFAHKKAQRVFSYLRNIGFNDPVICKSGNGWHTIYRCDLPNTDEVKEVLSQFLQSIALMFTDDKVDIDESVFNAARICKLYGTTAKKGANLPERPWRMSEIVYIPEDVKVNDISLFKKVASLLPKDEPVHTQQYRSGNNNEPFDLERFLNEHGVQYKKETCAKWTKYVLDHCFFNTEHRGKDAAIIQMASGAIKYTCLHNSCQQHTWQEVRQMLDPHAYDSKPQYQQQQQQQHQQQIPRKTQFQQAVQPVILPETADKGKKWLGMKDIKTINIYDIPHFSTGFKMLDDVIKFLFFCEVTILSGSNSSGKSSWLNTLILNTLMQGVKVALWSGELRNDVLKTWIQMVAAGKDHLKESSYGHWYVPMDIGEKIDNWMDGKFFLYNNEYGKKWEQLFDDMKDQLKMGIRLFILDNLMSMDIDIFDGDSNKKQKALISQIVDFAKREQVHIILVAHPRKVSTFIRKNDISGTSDLTNVVDNVFIVHRVNNDFKKLGGEYFGTSTINQYSKYSNVIEVAKNRMMGAQDALCGMYYEFESRRFKNENDEEIEYGWRDDNGVQQSMFSKSEQSSGLPFEAPYPGEEVPY